MSRAESRDEERRSLRIPLPVVVVGKTGEPRVEYAINLSCGGLCLQTDSPGSVGDCLRLRFRLGLESSEIDVEAEVTWCTCDEERGHGTRFCEVGLRFIDLAEACERRISAFIETQRGSAVER